MSYILQFIDSTRFIASSSSILLIMFLNHFIELNVNSDTMMKDVIHVVLNISIATVFLNRKILKMI